MDGPLGAPDVAVRGATVEGPNWYFVRAGAGHQRSTTTALFTRRRHAQRLTYPSRDVAWSGWLGCEGCVDGRGRCRSHLVTTTSGTTAHHNPTFLVHHAADSSLTSARDNCRGSCHCEDRGRRWADGATSSLWAKLHQSPHWATTAA